MSWVHWVLIGLGVWAVIAIVGALVVGRLIRANDPDTLDELRTGGLTVAPDPAGASDPRCDAELPAPRDGEHDRASEHRQD